jgi:hypothetical protein
LVLEPSPLGNGLEARVPANLQPLLQDVAQLRGLTSLVLSDAADTGFSRLAGAAALLQGALAGLTALRGLDVVGLLTQPEECAPLAASLAAALPRCHVHVAAVQQPEAGAHGGGVAG